THKLKALSLNGRFVKSHTTSGSIEIVCGNFPSPRCIVIIGSILISQYTAFGLFLLNQMDLLPQVTSRICLSLIVPPPALSAPSVLPHPHGAHRLHALGWVSAS